MSDTTTPPAGNRWQRTPLYVRILAAMLLAAALGALIFYGLRPLTGAEAENVRLPADLILRALRGLATPLVLFAILNAFATTEIRGREGGRLFALLLTNTLAAIVIGMAITNVFQPGRFFPSLREAVGRPPEAAAQTGPLNPIDIVVNAVPRTVLEPIVENDVFKLIAVALAFGIAFRQFKNRQIVEGKADYLPVEKVIGIGLTLLLQILMWVIAVIPVAVFSVVLSVVGRQGLGALFELGAFILVVLAALLGQLIFYVLRIRLQAGTAPLRVVRGVFDALVTAFSTASSTATMPITFRCLVENVGLRPKSASLGALVGANFNNDGTALYEAVAALFVAQALGIDLGLGQQIMVVLTAIVASVGAAGIPRGGPGDHDPGLHLGRPAHGRDRPAGLRRLVPGPLPHRDQRAGRRHRRNPARRPGRNRGRAARSRHRESPGDMNVPGALFTRRCGPGRRGRRSGRRSPRGRAGRAGRGAGRGSRGDGAGQAGRLQREPGGRRPGRREGRGGRAERGPAPEDDRGQGDVAAPGRHVFGETAQTRQRQGHPAQPRQRARKGDGAVAEAPHGDAGRARREGALAAGAQPQPERRVPQHEPEERRRQGGGAHRRPRREQARGGQPLRPVQAQRVRGQAQRAQVEPDAGKDVRDAQRLGEGGVQQAGQGAGQDAGHDAGGDAPVAWAAATDANAPASIIASSPMLITPARSERTPPRAASARGVHTRRPAAKRGSKGKSFMPPPALAARRGPRSGSPAPG